MRRLRRNENKVDLPPSSSDLISMADQSDLDTRMLVLSFAIA
jgi:hypothetical protein